MASARLRAGQPAPSFELPDHHGHVVRSGDLLGRWVVLWWYPQAGTLGCTVESQGFRDLAARFDDLGAQVVGASFDAPVDNAQFCTDQELPFPLLSDVGGSVGEAFGVRRDAGSRWAHLPERRTFLIDPAGVVREVYDVSDVDAHPGEVLADLERLRAEEQS
jgi:peroxiredoxin Q/BCP